MNRLGCRHLHGLITGVIFSVTGKVFYGDGDPDPLTLPGFLQIEGKMVNDLVNATKDARDKAYRLIYQAADENADLIKKDSTGSFWIAVAFILAEYSRSTLDEVTPMTLDYQNKIAASSLASIAILLEQEKRSLTDGELSTIKNLSDNGSYFVKKRFNNDLMNSFSESIADFKSGEIDRDEFIGAVSSRITRSESYWPVYAVSALNTARNFAVLSESKRLEYLKAVYWNPLDERTTDFCNLIAGQEVSVSDALAGIENLANAQSMEQVIERSFFVESSDDGFSSDRSGQTIEFSDDEILDVLLQYGALAPPFHPYCRTLLLPVTNKTN